MASISDWLIVLHLRPYRDSSLILDTFSKQHGRIPVLAKGARSQSRRGERAALQMSAILDATLSGRSEMRNLLQFDVLRSPNVLIGEEFAMATYISELILRTTQSWSPMPEVFEAIVEAFDCLSDPELNRKTLRQLEWTLIQSLGTAVDFEHDHTGQTIDPKTHYQLKPEQGFIPLPSEQQAHIGGYFSGDSLLQIASGHWNSETLLSEMKRINQILLEPYLGRQPLKSRELWLQWRRRR
jgi:DNA repair protein RecO (recombination protein O)